MKADTIILAALTVITIALAAILLQQQLTTPLEAIAVVTGAICVWLTVKESVWNFPVSLLNVAVFCVVYFRSRLFGDASLQIVYVILTLVGWYLWLFGGEQRTALRVSRVKPKEALIVAVSTAVFAMVLLNVLHLAGGTATALDAVTTALSLAAQWLLNRKHVENWYCWIVADLIYVPMYCYKHLYLTAGLYAVFLVMATMGLRQWRAKWKLRSAGPLPPRGVEAVLDNAGST